MARMGSTKGRSPNRELYGRKGNNILLAPLDICRIRLDSDLVSEVIQSGNFIGFIVNASGSEIGTIENYDNSSTGEVSPIAAIKPSDRVMNSIADLPDTNTDTKVNANVGDRVTLEVYELGGLVRKPVSGTITEALALRRYNLFTTNVQAYKVEFEQNITPINIGARVVPVNGDGVIGMLITTKDLAFPDGAINLVYPASLI